MIAAIVVPLAVLAYVSVAGVMGGLTLRFDRAKHKCEGSYCGRDHESYGVAVGVFWPLAWGLLLGSWIATRPTKEQKRIASLKEIERLERELGLVKPERQYGGYIKGSAA